MDTKEMSIKLRELRGYVPRRVVAEEIGISTSALGMYEDAKRIPKDDIKILIADYYHVPVGYLFFNEKINKKSRK